MVRNERNVDARAVCRHVRIRKSAVVGRCSNKYCIVQSLPNVRLD
jgi:hypothetical protein